MKIFLTGATGFIGSQVVKQLNQGEHELYALTRNESFERENIHILHGDFLNPDSYIKKLEKIKPSLVIHLAWYVEPGQYLEAEENKSFIEASLKFAHEVIQIGCQRFVCMGTCFEYDLSQGRLSEQSSTKPTSLYARSKLELKISLETLFQSKGTSFCWLRPFYQYGPGEDSRRLVPSVLLSLLKGDEARCSPGGQKLDFLHVEDVGSAIALASLSDLQGTVNIGSSKAVSVKEIVTLLGEITGNQDHVKLGVLPYREGEHMLIEADTSKLIEGTGWKPKFNIQSGLEDTVSWWKGHLNNEVNSTD